MKRIVTGFIVLTATAVLTACGLTDPAEVTRPIRTPSAPITTGVPVDAVTPEPPPTPAVCTPMPETMRIHIRRDGDLRGVIEVEGLQSDDRPVLLITGNAPSGSVREEFQMANAVGPNGRFHHTFNFSDLDAPMEWQIQGKLIHNRGVACCAIELPLSADLSCFEE